MGARRFAILLLMLGAILSVAQTDSPELSLPQYVHELERLRQSAAAASDSAGAQSIADNLPSIWTVNADGHFFDIPTASLAGLLRAYAKERNADKLAAVNAQLDLLLSDARAMQSTKTGATEERQKLTEILSRREFRNVQQETWYDRLKQRAQEWIGRLLERILTSSAFPVVSRIVIWGLLAVAVAVAAFWVVRNYRQSNVYTSFSGSPEAISAKPWRDWQAEAQVAAQQGRWRDAIHLSYWAAISFLEGQGLWRPDRARTPREYLRLLPADDSHRDPLQQLTRSFESVWYGTEAATQDSFAGASALLERLGCR